MLRARPSWREWRCEKCGRVAHLPPRVTRYRCECQRPRAAAKPIDLKPAAERLGLTLGDLRHYAVALARWTRAGCPERTQEQVEARVAICRSCDQFVVTNGDGGRCRKCRCRVSSNGISLVNKARMATEDCPLGKWKE